MICCEGECNQGRDCPYRGATTMSEGNKQWGLGLLAGIVLTSLVAISINKMQATSPAVYMPKDVIEAYNMGLRDALKTNPPSMNLEQVCVNLWADKQPVR